MKEKGYTLVCSDGELRIMEEVNLEEFVEEECEKGVSIETEDEFKKFVLFKGYVYDGISEMKKALPSSMHHILTKDITYICVGKRKVSTLDEYGEVMLYPII